MKKRICTFVLLPLLLFSLFFVGCKKPEPAELTRLSAPQKLQIEGKTAVWDAVKNATGYTVSFGGQSYKTTDCFYDLSSLKAPETYIVAVAAFGDGYKDSQPIHVRYTAETVIDEGYDNKGFYYTLSEDKTGYAVAKGHANLKGEIIIPAYFKGLPVKKIADGAFLMSSSPFENPDPFGDGSYCNKVTTGIRLPATLEVIGNSAFSNMLNLKKIVIPDSVTEIGGNAFSCCKRLESVTLPKNLKVIPNDCFNYCALKEIKLPDTLERIEGYAFATEALETKRSTAQDFTELVIPASVKYIGYNAFAYCLKLQKITFLPRDAQLYGTAFSNTAWYDALPEGWITLGNVLYGYKGELPANTTLNVPEAVTYIADEALRGQKNLISAIIPDGVRLGRGVFSSCTALSEVKLPADLTKIPTQLFYNCKSLRRVDLPNGVIEIEKEAFRDSALESFTAPAVLKTVGDHAFFSCKNLTTVSLPAGLESIKQYAFSYCSNLPTIILPESLKSFGLGPFRGCDSLEKIYYEGSREQWNVLAKDADIDIPIYANGFKPFSNATIYTYSEVSPADSASDTYWRYVDGVPVPW